MGYKKLLLIIVSLLVCAVVLFSCAEDHSYVTVSFDGCSVSYDPSIMALTQEESTDTESFTKDLPITVSFTVPDGRSVMGYSVTADGEAVPYSEASRSLTFIPEDKKNYTISIHLEKTKEVEFPYDIRPFAITLDGTEYPLRDFTVDPSDVSIAVTDLFTCETTEITPDALSGTLSLKSGRYKIETSYASNVHTESVIVDGGQEDALTLFVSDAYLGGAVELEDTRYFSYGAQSEDAVKGQGWRIVDGMRDSVQISSHTFAFQNDFTGTTYYMEGTFDALNTSQAFRLRMGALLVSHMPMPMDKPGSERVMASICGSDVVLCVTDSWIVQDTVAIANYTDFGIEPSDSLRLGVLREGTEYYFFVNDIYVAKRTIESIPGESGIGVAGTNGASEIRDFNYSTSDALISALKAEIPAAPKSIDIYLIAGQSNAAGYTLGDFDTLLAADPNYVYGYSNVLYAGDSAPTLAGTSTNRFDWGLAHFGQGRADKYFGAEVGIASVLSEYYNFDSGKVAGLIKCAFGGTCLLDNFFGSNAEAGNWMPPSYASELGKEYTGICGGLYRRLIEETVLRVEQLRKIGYTEINIKGMFWMQGEGDRGAEEQYRKAFTYLRSDLIRDLGAALGEDLSDFAIIIGEISATFGAADPGTVAFNETFIEMQRELSRELDNVYIVNSSVFEITRYNGNNSYAVGSDSAHWNWGDMIEIGKLVGKCILENLA